MSIRKNRDGWFAPLDRIEDAMDAVATYLRDTDNLRTLDPSDVPGALASVYDVVNQTHPEPSRVSCRLHAGCGSGWRAVVAA